MHTLARTHTPFWPQECKTSCLHKHHIWVQQWLYAHCFCLLFILEKQCELDVHSPLPIIEVCAQSAQANYKEMGNKWIWPSRLVITITFLRTRARAHTHTHTHTHTYTPYMYNSYKLKFWLERLFHLKKRTLCCHHKHLVIVHIF